MRPSVVLDANRIAMRDAVARYRATNPRIFGSVLRGQDHGGSDPAPSPGVNAMARRNSAATTLPTQRLVGAALRHEHTNPWLLDRLIEVHPQG